MRMGADVTVTTGLAQRGSATNTPSYLPEASHSRMSETQESIQKLGYTLWARRGRPFGSPEIDWLEAERKVRQWPGVKD